MGSTAHWQPWCRAEGLGNTSPSHQHGLVSLTQALPQGMARQAQRIWEEIRQDEVRKEPTGDQGGWGVSLTFDISVQNPSGVEVFQPFQSLAQVVKGPVLRQTALLLYELAQRAT